ncbi:MAG: hypothetical protein N2Z74_04415 [Syntrophales bacterium]|nr:hypothetical protein [Syntrophales bacterium]
MNNLRYRTFVALVPLIILLMVGCGDTGKQQAGPAATKPEQAQPQDGAGKSGCYDIAYKVGRCAAKTMSNLPCAPGEDIPLPQECKGRPETDKGLADGRKSVY